jgi:hypothetical protein
VSGAVRLKTGGQIGKLDRGDFVELSIDGTAWRPWLNSVLAQMRARGLHAVSATVLVHAKPEER